MFLKTKREREQRQRDVKQKKSIHAPVPRLRRKQASISRGSGVAHLCSMCVLKNRNLEKSAAVEW